jgi:hypothetical protein
MNRRAALFQLGITAGSLVAFTACWKQDRETISDAYKKLGITNDEIKFLNELSEIILPADSDVKGAVDLDLTSFVLLMVNDCCTGDEQNDFMKGIKLLQKSIGDNSLNNHQIKSFLTEIQNDAIDENSDRIFVKKFIAITKQFLIQGFLTSKYFMTEIMPYEMLPGKFDGKFLIPNNHKPNIYG